MIHITDSAEKYFAQLLTKQKQNTQIRIFIKNLGTRYAECGICYYLPKTQNSNDIIMKFKYFSMYIDKTIIPYIQNTQIDIISNELGTQLTLKSPNLNKEYNNMINIQEVTKNKISLENRIKHILEYKINPQLAMHGGGVSLIQITEDSLAILQFYGGCNGCAMSNYTIKNGVETILKKFVPELNGVIDVTQHQHGSHSYY